MATLAGSLSAGYVGQGSLELPAMVRDEMAVKQLRRCHIIYLAFPRPDAWASLHANVKVQNRANNAPVPGYAV